MAGPSPLEKAEVTVRTLEEDAQKIQKQQEDTRMSDEVSWHDVIFMCDGYVLLRQYETLQRTIWKLMRRQQGTERQPTSARRAT